MLVRRALAKSVSRVSVVFIAFGTPFRWSLKALLTHCDAPSKDQQRPQGIVAPTALLHLKVCQNVIHLQKQSARHAAKRKVLPYLEPCSQSLLLALFLLPTIPFLVILVCLSGCLLAWKAEWRSGECNTPTIASTFDKVTA